MNDKTKTADEDVGTLNIHGWPRELQRRMKVVAAEESKTVKDVTIEACEEFLEKRRR